MLYKKNKNETLSDDLFLNPTAEYRGAPFWAWNDNLDEKELLRQIDCLKEMGFGGFHMHTRSGMATPYLSDEFMNLIASCVHKAKENNMLAWLYDEDRWPSGAAGGIVTKNKNFRSKYLVLTQEYHEHILDQKKFSNYIGISPGDTPECTVDESVGYKDGVPYLLSVYDINLNADGTLKSYKMIDPGQIVSGTKWYAYVYVEHDVGWFNGQAYLDTLNKEAVAEFLKITHDTYFAKVGNEFDQTIPAIFTDEPQFRKIDRIANSHDNKSKLTGWTNDFPITFRQKFGYDLVCKLPEIFWDLSNMPSQARYHFHAHMTERFAEAFSDQYGKWCQEHHIAMTGHFMEEPTLESQSHNIGEAMRNYKDMGLPGIDMLCDAVELTTAKQTQSVVHQGGKEGMTSELYGVTGWDFDFRGHKFQGDWQAALGVTVRVPHLSWYSMKGAAKRDYPASINYQSAWYKEYPYVEDHFARLNTALTRGIPDVHIGVIHPVESYWLHYGPNDTNDTILTQLEKDFVDLNRWLLSSQLDFDYISESLLPTQYMDTNDNQLCVGKMHYSVVIVPPLETIRQTTVDILLQFSKKGGKVLFLGKKPPFIDALISNYIDELWQNSTLVPFSSIDIISSLEPYRDVYLRKADGKNVTEYLYQKRIDGNFEWLFIARFVKPSTPGCSTLPSIQPEKMKLYYRGLKKPIVYDTLSGTIHDIPYSFEGNKTVIDLTLYDSDSILIRFETSNECQKAGAETVSINPTRIIDYKNTVSYQRTDCNVLILDIPEWSEDGVSYYPQEEILKIDGLLRQKYHFPDATGADIQPWLLADDVIEHHPFLKFTIRSDISVSCDFAFEEAEKIWLNHKPVSVTKNDRYVDNRIYRMPLGKLKKGINTLIVQVPFGKRLSLENMFLLGDFNVTVFGAQTKITSPSKKIAFGSIVHQGLPFYGSDLIYQIPVDVGHCNIVIRAGWYKGALISVCLDKKPIGKIVYSPYSLTIENVPAGHHIISLTLHLSRVNTFGALHNCRNESWIGPSAWFTSGHNWSYEYQLKDNGILKSPIIEIFDK